MALFASIKCPFTYNFDRPLTVSQKPVEMALRSLLLLLVATAARHPASVEAKCVMTQTCVNPDNVPDYNQCIPKAYKKPMDPLPVRVVVE